MLNASFCNQIVFSIKFCFQGILVTDHAQLFQGTTLMLDVN